METLFIYFIKVNVALAVFYLLYALLFKKDTFLKLRRFYFLLAIVFSCLYPFLAIEALNNVFPLPKPSQEKVQTMVFVEQPTATDFFVEEAPITPLSLEGLMPIFYKGLLFISLLFFVRFAWQLISIFRIRVNGKKQSIFGMNIYHLSGEVTPFSFFKWIFINTETHSEIELNQILLHEKTHAQQWHSVDVVLIELVCIVFWWNPFVWLMKREIAMNLEYLADNNVLSQGINFKEYQYHLLRLTYHEVAVPIVNNFNVSQLKQRIMMMNKTKSPMRKLAKYATVLPLLLLLIAANSAYAQKVEPKKKTDEVFVVVEKQPEFPGGQAAMMKFLSENVKYPKEAHEKGIQGRVVVNFIVEKDGSLSEFQVMRSVDPLLDAEAVRVIKTMPNWMPGTQRDKPVRVRYTLPIIFRLQGNNKTGTVPPPPPPPYSNNKGDVPPPPPPPYTAKTVEELKNSDEVFVVVEKQPEFPGGQAAMMNFLSENIRYPKEAHEKGIEGRVTCNFVVMKDGNIADVNVVRGVNLLLDEEAVRVIQSMPAWKPGTQRGQPVNVRFTLPVVFRLNGKADEKKEATQLPAKNVKSPEFPGGESAFMKFVAENIKYPVIAQENGIQGLVNAVFSVDSKGKVTFVKINKSVDPSLDKEVKRVIKIMPDWTPGTYNGEATSVTSGVTVVFRLQGDNVKPYDGLTPENAIVVVGYAKN